MNVSTCVMTAFIQSECNRCGKGYLASRCPTMLFPPSAENNPREWCQMKLIPNPCHRWHKWPPLLTFFITSWSACEAVINSSLSCDVIGAVYFTVLGNCRRMLSAKYSRLLFQACTLLFLSADFHFWALLMSCLLIVLSVDAIGREGAAGLVSSRLVEFVCLWPHWRVKTWPFLQMMWHTAS